jgi:hypothetical protein
MSHLLHFPTWEALDAQGLRRAELVALGRAWIAGAAASG